MVAKVIERNGTRYAEFLPALSDMDRTAFFSPAQAGFQFGVMVQDAGYSEPAHYHPTISASAVSASEFLFVQDGSLTVSFHDVGGEVFDSVRVGQGDAIVLIDGVHSYRADSKFKALVIKQGPYSGDGGKILVDRT